MKPNILNEAQSVKELQAVGSAPRQDIVPSWRRGGLPWVLLACLFVAEFCLFYQYLNREILWAFPGHWDQTRYLQESQSALQYLVNDGLVHGLVHAVSTQTPTGNILGVEAAVLYLFLGPTRLTALLVLFAHWILFQLVAVMTIRWLSKRWSVASIGLALLLLTASQFRVEGSLMVFQIDFPAYCTFGVLVCLMIRSNVFADRRITIIAAIVAAYLIVLRFITLVYLGAVGFVFCAAAGGLWLVKGLPPIHHLAKIRITNALLALAITAAICGPVFAHNWPTIHGYYFLGTAREQYVRAAEVGIHRRLDSLLFYPRAVWDEHAGQYFRRAAIGLTLVSLAALAWARGARVAKLLPPSRSHLDMPLAFVTLSACLLGPYLVLTSDINKVTYVGSIFMPPLWAMVVLAVVSASDLLSLSRRNAGLRYVPVLMSVVVFGMALSYQVHSYTRPSRYTRQREDVERVLELHDLIGQKAREFGLQSPGIAVDHLDDAFHPAVINATQRERHQIILFAYPSYPWTVTAVSEDEVLPLWRRADFALVTISEASNDSPDLFDHSMAAMRPKLLAICEQTMLPLRETTFFGRRVRLYMRPSLRVQSAYPDWLDEDGTTLYSEASVLQDFSKITLQGSTIGLAPFPEDEQTLTATLDVDGQPSQLVPSQYTETNGQYTIHLSVPRVDAPANAAAMIRLHFKQHFVPKELGINGDTRRLVVRPPGSIKLEREHDLPS